MTDEKIEQTKNNISWLHLEDILTPAAKQGDLETVQYIFSKTLGLTSAPLTGLELYPFERALYAADKYGHPEIVKFLLETAILCDLAKYGILLIASQRGHVHVVKWFCTESNIHSWIQNTNPIGFALMSLEGYTSKTLDIITAFIEAGCYDNRIILIMKDHILALIGSHPESEAEYRNLDAMLTALLV